jgi:hypothetical protein
MNTARANKADGAQDYMRMPLVYILLFWVLIIDVVVMTALVWMIAFKTVAIAEKGALIPIEQFNWLLMGYHVMLLIWSLVAYLMQVAWRTTAAMALYPTAMVLCNLSLHVMLAQIVFLLLQGD